MSTPKILRINLKRVEFDRQTLRQSKIHHPINVPLEGLDLTEFVAQEVQDVGNSVF